MLHRSSRWRVVVTLALMLATPLLTLSNVAYGAGYRSPRVNLPTSNTDDWPTFMHDNQRTGKSAESFFTTANAPTLTKLWSYKTGGGIAAEPTVVGNTVYVGSWDGYMYALNASTGALIWKTFLGQTTTPLCAPSTIGITSAATVLNGIVYVGGGDSYWYALDAGTGAVLWKVFTGDNSQSGGYYNWSSPLIYNGYAYIGLASNCDNPLAQGKLMQVDLTSHSVVNTLNLVPTGQVGGGIWTTPSVDPTTNTIYVTTGTKNQTTQIYAQAIIAIDAGTLTVKSYWDLPDADAVVDSDWGATPVLFDDANGHHWVVASNKDGYLYGFDRTNLAAGPVWRQQISIGGACPTCGDGSISTVSVMNGTIYVAGGNTTINGVGYPGAVRALDANGNILWEHGAQGPVVPAVTTVNGLVIDEPGNTIEVLNAANGQRLYSYTTGGPIYAAASVSHGAIYTGSVDGNVYALALGNPITPPADVNCASGWICQDINSSGGTETQSNGSWNLASSGAGVGANPGTDAFRLDAQSVTGDVQVVGQLASASGQAGVMLRQSNDPGAPFYALLRNGANLVVEYRSQFGGVVTTLNQVASALPVYLKILRMGDTFQAATSTDGTNYTLIPGGTTILMLPATVLGGLADANGAASFASVSTGAPGTPPATPPSPSPCPPGWNCQDIGNPLTIGDQSLNNGVWSVKGGGADINGYRDQFHFVWQAVAGDATLSARVTAQTNTNGYAKAGVMLRQSTDPAAAYYAMFLTPGNGIDVSWRTSEGMRVQENFNSGTVPAYLQIERSGNTFTAWTSPDGTNWTYLPGSSVVLNTSGGMLAGLAVTSRNATSSSAATIDSVNLAQSAPPAPTVCPAGWNCADIGNPHPAGSQSQNGTVWTVIAGGADIYATADQFRYIWQTLPGDGSFSALVTSQSNSNDYAKAGVMIRASSDPSAAYYGMFVTPGHGIVIQYRTALGQFAGQATTIPSATTPVYVKVGRAGNVFTAYTSSDGSVWTAVANSSITITMPANALAGIAVTSHNTSPLGTVTFDKTVLISGCPSGWNCADIGEPAVTGGNTLNNGTWTITAGGTDIWGTSDQFHYVWQQQNGDGSFSARVVSQVNSDVNAKAGLMYRQTVDPSSPYYAIYMTPGNGIAVQYRATYGANAGQAATLAGTTPRYFKLVRAGNTFSAYTSADGTTWTLVPGSTMTIAMNNAALAGMAVTAHSGTLTGGATFDNVSLTAPPPVVCPTGWTCADIGQPPMTGSQSLANGVWTIQGNGTDIWATSDQFHYVYQSVPGDASLIGHITAQANTDQNAKAGLMFRQTTDPASPFYAIYMTPGSGIAVQYRVTQGAYTGQAATLSGTVPAWFKISRAGNVFTAYTSPDGTTWTPVPNATMTIGISGPFLLGMAVTSHQVAAMGSATFDNVSLTTPTPVTCPTGWTCADVGNPAIAGGQNISNGVWTVTGGGTDIFGTADQFHYVYQSSPGDNTLSAHFTAQANTSSWAKAGLMFRLSTANNAPYYAVYVTPGNGYAVQYRSKAGGGATQATAVAGGTLPVYLRIVRVGTTFTAYTSPDGATWTLIPNSSRTLASMSGALLVGVAITSHNSAKLGSATLDSVALASAGASTPTRKPNPVKRPHEAMEVAHRRVKGE